MRRWDKTEEDRLRREYQRLTPRELLKVFGRSIKSISRKAEEMGLTKDEDTTFKSHSQATKKKWDLKYFNRRETSRRFLEMIKNRDQSGSKNPNWKGDQRKEPQQRDREGERYKSWRRKVFERDNYTCFSCQKRGGDLEAHHIELFSTHIHLRHVVSNGITLCKKCHKSIRQREKNFEEKFKKYVNAI